MLVRLTEFGSREDLIRCGAIALMRQLFHAYLRDGSARVTWLKVFVDADRLLFHVMAAGDQLVMTVERRQDLVVCTSQVHQVVVFAHIDEVGIR